MSRQRTIQYGIDEATGYVVSRVGSEVAFFVIGFKDMKAEDGYAVKGNLERMPILEVAPSLRAVRWTRKIPVATKNLHRKFWGMKPLREAA